MSSIVYKGSQIPPQGISAFNFMGTFLSVVYFPSGKMASNKPVDKLADNLKGLVIGASGTIPGYQHGMFSLISKQIYRKRERDVS